MRATTTPTTRCRPSSSAACRPASSCWAWLRTDASAKASWIYDGRTFWSFDDPATIADKMAYVRVQGLGGAFLWDFSGDDAQGALLAAIEAGSGP